MSTAAPTTAAPTTAAPTTASPTTAAPTTVPTIYGCIDDIVYNYDSNANTDDGSCEYRGCTDGTAINYDANATVDDGSCMAEFITTWEITESSPTITFPLSGSGFNVAIYWGD